MANLKAAVQWIALNDNAGEKDTVEDTAGYLTVWSSWPTSSARTRLRLLARSCTGATSFGRR